MELIPAIIQEDVGERIRFFRKERDLTQEQLGLAIGAGTASSAKAMIAKIEGGQIPGGLRLKKIANGLKCSADILLSGTSRELFEVIRYYVRPNGKLNHYQQMAFRSGRILLHCAIVRGTDGEPDEEMLEAANRLFFMAESAPRKCRKLFEQLGNHDRLEIAGKDDVQELVRHAMHDRTQHDDPNNYLNYTFASDMAKVVREHYIKPVEAPGEEQPSATAPTPDSLNVIAYPFGKGQGSPMLMETLDISGRSAVRVDGDSLEPLACNGQLVLIAPESRIPSEGDLVVCWSRRKGTLYKRLVSAGEKVTLFSANPTVSDTLSLPREDILAMRVIVGVLFE